MEQYSLDKLIFAENDPSLHHAAEEQERAINSVGELKLLMVNGTFCAELRAYFHTQETVVMFSENCWIKSLNYNSCKTVHVRYDIFQFLYYINVI